MRSSAGDTKISTATQEFQSAWPEHEILELESLKVRASVSSPS